ncbi:MAG: RHS repeat-associated core domain-containing protein [Clostridia bacterium]|nr:RHS repeat-associated core domain-containing protein [Clostridia bacterium]
MTLQISDLASGTYASEAERVAEGVTYNAISYSYDTRGNILSKVYSLNGETVDTVTYTYTDTVWADRLTAFDGVAISYDQIGNPLNWHDGATLTWQHGRELSTYTDSDKAVSYTYNENGIRTSKTINGIETTYTVVDGTLRRLTSGENTLEFINGTSVIFNGTEYWYVFNAKNDVIGLIDANGEYVVEYTYDSWGNITAQTDSDLARLNPFRYRGYIYDEETGWYYCQTRYYDPNVGRWLNADGYYATGDLSLNHNMYAYCLNNPIVYVDPTGTAVYYVMFGWDCYFIGGGGKADLYMWDDCGGSATFKVETSIYSFGLGMGFSGTYGYDVHYDSVGQFIVDLDNNSNPSFAWEVPIGPVSIEWSTEIADKLHGANSIGVGAGVGLSLFAEQWNTFELTSDINDVVESMMACVVENDNCKITSSDIRRLLSVA